MNTTAVYFYNLSVMVFLKSLFENNFFIKIFKKNALDIFYIESTLVSNKLLIPFLCWMNVRVRKLEFKLKDIKDSRGELIRLRIPRKDIFNIQRKILNSDGYKSICNKSLSQNRLPDYISKGIIDGGIMDEQSVSRRLFCIQVVSWHMHKKSYALSVFIDNKKIWFDIYKDYAETYNVNLVFIKEKFFSFRIIDVNNLIRSKPFLYGVAKNIKYRNFFKKDKSTVKSQCKLYVDGRGDVNFINDGNHSDFFWYLNSSFPADHILYKYFSPEEELLLEKEGVQHVQDGVVQNRTFKRKYNKPKIINNPKFKSESKLIKSLVNDYDLDRYTWYQFFRKYDVKLYFTWYKYTKDHMAIADAISDNGGVSILWQMAFDGAKLSGCVANFDLLFAFSQFTHELDKSLGSTIRYTVITGYPKDYAPALLKESAIDVRKKLQNNGAKKILFVIDENSLDDNRWHTGHEVQRENYSYILEKVLETPWLGVVFKPKVAKTLNRRLGTIATLLQKATETGRCHIYDTSGRHTTSVSPILAGLSADVCVHSHLSSGTAAIECALEGIPTLLIDREGCPDSKLYELPIGKVIFKNWPETINAVMKHFNTPNGTPGFGDWSSIIDELDPFRDGKAANRIGTYLDWLIKGFENGLNREEVMYQAAERYKEKWGSDKVILQ